MPVEQNHPHEIGVVTGVSGDAYAQTSSGTRILEPGSPIYQGEELVTGGNGNVEVRFADDTLISQGANSRIALDDYVYDPDGGESSFLGDIAQGTFRTVTGKIAEQNPDRFKLGSPLATIGIRGTIILSEVSSDGEKHGVEEIHAGKAMLLQSKATGAIRQLFSGQMVDVGKSGILSPVRSLSTQERDNFRKIASENIRQEQEIREQQDDDQQDDQIDEQNDEQQNDEQQGEQQDGPQEELPGDVDPGGGDPGAPVSDGGVLHPGQGVLDPGDDALVGQQKFNPDKIDQPPEPFEKPEVEEREGNESQQEEQQQEGEDGSSGDTDGGETEEGNNTNQQNENEAEDANTDNDDTGDTENDDTGGESEDTEHDIHGSGLIEGTNEADTITGSSSDDTIKGLGGNDTLYGEAGDDELFGGAGNDSLYGGAGEDMLNGGTGNNYLDGGSGESHETDFASFAEQEHGVTVDLSNKNDAGEVTVTTDTGHDVLVNIEGVIGTNHEDTLVGDEGVNRFNPLLNSDYDGSTMESINGGDGSDWIQFETIDYSVDITLKQSESSYAELKDGSTVKSKIKLSNIENVQGSSQADKITGSDEANTLLGEAGNDSISGGAGDDSIDGGTGNDFISGGEGADIIDGGEGIDSLSYDYITAGSDFGIDITLSGSGKGTAKLVGASDPEDTFTSIEKILGSGTHDTFNGSDAADTFDGNDGDDRIYGNGGDDILAGGAGSDQIYGGTGADSISGGSGADVLYGEADNDSLSGGAGDDSIFGGDGDDFIQGGTGNNVLRGGIDGTSSGNDSLSYLGFDSVNIIVGDNTANHTLSDDTGSDSISGFATYIGSDGNDEFIGDADGDTFIGGKGNDIFNGGDGNNLFIGGEGTDTISFADSSTAVTVTVQETGNTTVTHSGGEDVFSGVESFIGSAQADTFNGSSNDETFSGEAGNDTIYAGAGNDTLSGGTGINYLDGQGGDKDFISFADAGSGVTVALDGANEVTFGGGAGTDVFLNIEGIIGSKYNDTLTGDDNDNYFKVGLNDNFNLATPSTYESVTGGGGSDWVQFDDLSSQYYIVAEMNSNHVFVKSTSDNSVVNKVILSSIENLLGTSGNDTITGSSIANTLDGAAGDDSISGGDGSDVLYGGIGNDSLAGEKGDNTLDGGEGYDRIEYSASTSGVTFNINDSGGSVTHSDGTDQFSNIEIYQGSDHDDIFNGSSNSETMIGGDGADSFTGGGGNDHIIAGLGNDSIDGGSGIDTLDYSDTSKAVTIIADTGSGSGTAERPDYSETDTFKGIEHFIGSSCDDSFTGSDASETFEGGNGTDNIDGGGGTDFISFAGLGTGINIDLSNNAEGSGNLCTVTLGGGNDTFKNIEGVIGSNYSDTITASSSGTSTIQGGGGADTINLVDGKATQILYTSLSEGGDTINNFQNHDTDATNSDKFCFSGSDFDSSASFYTFDDGYTDSANIGTTSAYFIFDDNNQLWYDSNGDQAGGATMIAQIASGDDVTADDISFT
ncbi:FecR domain-containing protein [Maridesulfovibrio sp.]|uniref:FecR domain-containing protein n=1 Tax=Maridesulfovibrio sp. TaxID=2795000 RepID=UPI002A18CB34|nr:FecR domain-containing protein [Maridesulfovibrio sp.]